MNIVFFGSSKFAVPSLNALLASKHKVSCVVTQPDKPKGRGLHFSGTVIKTIASESGIMIRQPGNVNDLDSVNYLKGMNPDLFVVIAYGQILSSEILNIPKIFSINAHASLLPKYRGAAPINWAIINGEEITGVTIIKMSEKMDAGAIISQKEIRIDNSDTAITLEDTLSGLAGHLLLDSLVSFEDNNYKLKPQDGGSVSFAPKLKKEDGRIDWNKPAGDILNLIRGCISWPGAFTYYKGKLLKIYKARVAIDSEHKSIRVAGEIVRASKEGIVVATEKDNLLIEELQIEGKKRMKIEEFIAGHKICAGEILKEK